MNSFRNLSASALVLIAIVGITGVFLNKEPLQDAHWDSPIYLMRGKVIAQTSLLEEYRTHASEIAATLPTYKPGVVDTPYWSFMRLGNSVLIGSVLAIAGTDITALRLVNGLYILLMAGALVIGTLATFRLVTMFENALPHRYLAIGAVISAGLYMASDIYRYMSGNLISEVPALFLYSSCILAFVEAARRQSHYMALLSGLIAFAIYVFKMELVWAYAAFILSLTGIIARRIAIQNYVATVIISGLFALVLYGVYALWFHHLADPRLILTFAAAHQDTASNAVATHKLIIVAGGLLWIGLLLALRFQFRNPLVWFSIFWLVVLLVPLLGGAHHARYFAIILPPLLLSSTLGWAALIERITTSKISRAWLVTLLLGITGLLALSHAETYKLLKTIPGGWRLQYAKAYLSPPKYERLDFPINELRGISLFLYQSKKPVVVIIDKNLPEVYSRVISYFGPRLSNLNQLYPIEKPLGKCGRTELRPDREQVMFCTTPPSNSSLHALEDKAHILLLATTSDKESYLSTSPDKVLYRAGNLFLVPWPQL